MQAVVTDEAQKRRAIAWAVALTAHQAFSPEQYERELLARYARAELSLTQVLNLLDTRIHHLLYRSQAHQPQQAADLAALVGQSRARNKCKNITGLLCYHSSGHFVQVVEGPPAEVQALFARIQQDKRHCQVQALCTYTSNERWFTDWQMALVEPEAMESHWLLDDSETRAHKLLKPQIPISSPALASLLKVFSSL